jgi:hypothetical protein
MTELLDQGLAAARSLSPDLKEEQAAVGEISADRAGAEASPAPISAGHYTPSARRGHSFSPPEAVKPVICTVSRKSSLDHYCDQAMRPIDQPSDFRRHLHFAPVRHR